MGKKEATLADIANLANVSTSTVSRVLNFDDTLQVQARTRRKIIEAAEELSYNFENKKVKQRTLGFYFSISAKIETEDVFYHDLRLEIEILLKISGINLQIITSDDTPRTVKNINGIIALGLFMDNEELDWLEEFQKPLIFIDSNPNPDKYISVEFDLYKSTEKALTYLLDMGHTKIGFIGGDDEIENDDYLLTYTDDRENAYRNFMLKNNLLREDYIKIGDFTPEGGYSKFMSMFSQADPPTALFVANDSLVIGCYRAAYELGLRIPDDVSVIGFNDIESAKYLIPSLSTIRLDMKVMAELAVQFMYSIVKEDLNQPMRVIIPNELLIRDSVKKLD